MPCMNKNDQRTLMAFMRGKVQHFRKAEVYTFVRPQHVDRAWTSISGFQTQVLQYIYVFIYLSVSARKSTNDKLGPFTSGRFGDKEMLLVLKFDGGKILQKTTKQFGP